ncbi:hypothetical protein AGMMS49928_05470 [Spirochaetia bacterium]|nr:hypothetical protein AGMMS49928_05470 [Spirochaetia bacterium]
MNKYTILGLVFFLIITHFVSAQLFSGDGGKGIVIAVPPPNMSNQTSANAWIPQLFQDIITGNLARFSAMTVLDRKNEKLTLAEQELSANGNYSEDNYIRMGQLTNAQYIVAGTILPISGQYQTNFRINNTETNQIATSFDKRYQFKDVESGYAAKEITFELLKGMGVSVTETGRQALLSVKESQTQATIQLARGMSAEKNGDIVDALGYLYQASETSQTRNEATNRIDNISISVPQGSLREQAQAGLALREKWTKIQKDLLLYTLKNGILCVVYDFSEMKSRIDYDYNGVHFTMLPGVQIIPNVVAFSTWKKIHEEWNKVKNEEWARTSRIYFTPPRGTYSIYISIIDEYGDKIGETTRGYLGLGVDYDRNDEPVIQSQFKYFSKARYQIGNFDASVFIPLDKLTDTVTQKIEKITLTGFSHSVYNDVRNEIRALGYSFDNYDELIIDVPVYSYTEWQEWIAGQGR